VLAVYFGVSISGLCAASDASEVVPPAESSFEVYARTVAGQPDVSAWRLGDTLFVHQSRTPVEVAEEIGPRTTPRKFDLRQMAADLAVNLRYAMRPARGPEGAPASQLMQATKPGGALGAARRPKNPIDVLRRVPAVSLLWMLGPAAILLAISGICGRLARNVTPYSRPDMAAPPAPPLLRFARKW
jgi:hypothetical protein